MFCLKADTLLVPIISRRRFHGKFSFSLPSRNLYKIFPRSPPLDFGAARLAGHEVHVGAPSWTSGFEATHALAEETRITSHDVADVSRAESSTFFGGFLRLALAAYFNLMPALHVDLMSCYTHKNQ